MHCNVRSILLLLPRADHGQDKVSEFSLEVGKTDLFLWHRLPGLGGSDCTPCLARTAACTHRTNLVIEILLGTLHPDADCTKLIIWVSSEPGMALSGHFWVGSRFLSIHSKFWKHPGVMRAMAQNSSSLGGLDRIRCIPGPNTTGLLERLYNACTLA